MTALLGILMETLIKGRPRKWPRFIRTLEARLRDKTFGDSGLTPRGVVNGWFNVTPLANATGQIAEIPAELCYEHWVREMVGEHLDLSKELDEVMEHNEVVRGAYANETRKGPRIEVGNLVFLRKGHVEKAATAMSFKLLSKCDGPYQVSEMPSEQNAILVDPLTEQRVEACSNGRTVAVDRLILYPVRKEDLPRTEEPVPDSTLVVLNKNDIIAVTEENEESGSIFLAQLNEKHAQQQNLGVYPMESVGRTKLRDRPWKLMPEARRVGYSEVVCRIFLEPTGVLTTGSVEELMLRGIAI